MQYRNKYNSKLSKDSGELYQKHLSVELPAAFTKAARKQLVSYSTQLLANYPKKNQYKKYNHWVEKRNVIDKLLCILDNSDYQRFNPNLEIADSSLKDFKHALDACKSTFSKGLAAKLSLPFTSITGYFFKWYPKKIQAALLVEGLEKLLDEIKTPLAPVSRNY
ncbi:MAG: hypothetical protein V4471_07655 [Pseudomonadota bacterium]